MNGVKKNERNKSVEKRDEWRVTSSIKFDTFFTQMNEINMNNFEK